MNARIPFLAYGDASGDDLNEVAFNLLLLARANKH